MKKLIFRNIFKDITYFFLITSISLTLIVWVIQAVNYLEFVSEDGHSFRVYFMYTLLNIPKIFSKLILFVFFISVFFTISKYEENNEILIFWTYGIKKTEFINKIIKFSLIYFMLSFVLNIFIVPKTQDLAKSYIRNSNIDYFPSIIKTKHFNDTVSKLTIFIDKKNSSGEIENIFIKENIDNSKSKIITAKEGILVKKKNNYFLILYYGKIINIDKDNTNIIKFKKSEFNLSRYETKSTIFPKIQETSSGKLFECINSFINNKSGFFERLFVCDNESINPVFQEMYERSILPLYIIVSAFIASCLIMKSKTEFNFFKYKSVILIFGFLLIIFSEGSISAISFSNLGKTFFVLTPIIISFFIYLIFITSKKVRSL